MVRLNYASLINAIMLCKLNSGYKVVVVCPDKHKCEIAFNSIQTLANEISVSYCRSSISFGEICFSNGSHIKIIRMTSQNDGRGYIADIVVADDEIIKSSDSGIISRLKYIERGSKNEICRSQA